MAMAMGKAIAKAISMAMAFAMVCAMAMSMSLARPARQVLSEKQMRPLAMRSSRTDILSCLQQQNGDDTDFRKVCSLDEDYKRVSRLRATADAFVKHKQSMVDLGLNARESPLQGIIGKIDDSVQMLKQICLQIAEVEKHTLRHKQQAIGNIARGGKDGEPWFAQVVCDSLAALQEVKTVTSF